MCALALSALPNPTIGILPASFFFFSFSFFYVKRVSFFKIFDRALKEYGSLGKKKKETRKK
jgi:hypothetical protein